MVIVMIATVTAVVACRRSIARCRTHVLGPGELHAPLASVDCLKDGCDAGDLAVVRNVMAPLRVPRPRLRIQSARNPAADRR